MLLKRWGGGGVGGGHKLASHKPLTHSPEVVPFLDHRTPTEGKGVSSF